MNDEYLDDAAAELVLAEVRRVGADATTDPLVQVLAEIRQTFADAPPAPDRARIAALAATAAAAAAERRPTARRRRWTFRPAFVAAASAACLGVTFGLAAGERLPAPAQRLVANVADVVGVDLPDPDDGDDGAPDVTVVRRDPPAVVTTGKGEGRGRGQPPTTVLPPGDRGADPAVTSAGQGPPISNPSATAPGSTGSTSPAATAPGSTAPRGGPEAPSSNSKQPGELGKPEKISG